MDAPRGAVSLGFRPVGCFFRITSFGFGAGIEPARLKSEFSARPLSFQTSDEPESNRWWREPAMFSRCPTIGHSSFRNTVLRLRHTPRQGRAHRVVVETTPLETYERCFALPTLAHWQFVRSMRVHRPCRSSASNAARVEAPQRTRMRLAACPWPQRGDWRRVLQGEAESEGKPRRNACMGANAQGADSGSTSGSDAGNETPPEGIRGRSRSSEIGATDLPEG